MIASNDKKFPNRTLLLNFLRAQLDPHLSIKEKGDSTLEMIEQYDEELFRRCMAIQRVKQEPPLKDDQIASRLEV